MPFAHRPHLVRLCLLVGLSGLAAPPPAHAQVNAPSTVDLGNITTVAAGTPQAFTQDGGFTDASGIAGGSAIPPATPNNGYTLFRYGNPAGGGRLTIASTSLSPATFAFATANPASPTVSASPLHFDVAQKYTFPFVTPKPGTTAATLLRVSADDSNPSSFLALNNQADLVTYNARLNDILKFDAANFIDPNTNLPIVVTGPTAVGSFSYTFSNFDTSVGTYRDIALVFTPVPEPVSVIAVAAAGFGLAHLVRRRFKAGRRLDRDSPGTATEHRAGDPRRPVA